jgi:hypothetical protein
MEAEDIMNDFKLYLGYDERPLFLGRGQHKHNIHNHYFALLRDFFTVQNYILK